MPVFSNISLQYSHSPVLPISLAFLRAPSGRWMVGNAYKAPSMEVQLTPSSSFRTYQHQAASGEANVAQPTTNEVNLQRVKQHAATPSSMQPPQADCSHPGQMQPPRADCSRPGQNAVTHDAGHQGAPEKDNAAKVGPGTQQYDTSTTGGEPCTKTGQLSCGLTVWQYA